MPGGAGLPEGPARTRASDADRELAVAALRRHWRAGRLDETELEDRVSSALAGRTLGELRKLLEDLPGEPPAKRRTMPGRRGEPALHGPPSHWQRAVSSLKAGAATLLVGLTVLVIVALIASSGDDDREGSYGPPPADRITRVAAGERGSDAEMEFEALAVERAARLPLRPSSTTDAAEALASAEGQEFLVVVVKATNRSDDRATPFCATGARLYTDDDEGHELVERLYELDGNEHVCSEGMTPGEAARFRLAFSVAEGAGARDIDVWNAAEEDDIGGATRLRMALPPETDASRTPSD